MVQDFSFIHSVITPPVGSQERMCGTEDDHLAIETPHCVCIV